MVRQRIRRLARGACRSVEERLGFSLAELVVVVAVIGVLGALGLPAFTGFWRTSTLKAGAQELVVLLNSARQQAIKENVSVCVATDGSSPSMFGTKVKVLLGTSTCTATAPTTRTCAQTGGTTPCVWTGAGTAGDGSRTLSNGVQVRPPSTAVSFTHLGSAVGGTFKMKNPMDQATATVTVAVSGRVSISYPRHLRRQS